MRHELVPGKDIYPGNAKNSIDTLSRAGSIDSAVAGTVRGTVNDTVKEFDYI